MLFALVHAPTYYKFISGTDGGQRTALTREYLRTVGAYGLYSNPNISPSDVGIQSFIPIIDNDGLTVRLRLGETI